MTRRKQHLGSHSRTSNPDGYMPTRAQRMKGWIIDRGRLRLVFDVPPPSDTKRVVKDMQHKKDRQRGRRLAREWDDE